MSWHCEHPERPGREPQLRSYTLPSQHPRGRVSLEAVDKLDPLRRRHCHQRRQLPVRHEALLHPLDRGRLSAPRATERRADRRHRPRLRRLHRGAHRPWPAPSARRASLARRARAVPAIEEPDDSAAMTARAGRPLGHGATRLLRGRLAVIELVLGARVFPSWLMTRLARLDLGLHLRDGRGCGERVYDRRRANFSSRVVRYFFLTPLLFAALGSALGGLLPALLAVPIRPLRRRPRLRSRRVVTRCRARDPAPRAPETQVDPMRTPLAFAPHPSKTNHPPRTPPLPGPPRQARARTVSSNPPTRGDTRPGA